MFAFKDACFYETGTKRFIVQRAPGMNEANDPVLRRVRWIHLSQEAIDMISHHLSLCDISQSGQKQCQIILENEIRLLLFGNKTHPF